MTSSVPDSFLPSRPRVGPYSNKSPLAQAIYIKEDTELVICSSSGRMLLVNTGAILPKTTKDTQGISAMNVHVVQTNFDCILMAEPQNLPQAVGIHFGLRIS